MIYKIFWVLRALIYKPFLGRMGWKSYLGKPLFISGMTRIFIGSKVRIYPNARMEVLGQKAKIVIEDNTSIGQGLHIISAQDGILEIGKNVTLSANVFMTNVEHAYQEIDRHILEQALLVKNTFIGDNCFIGYGAVIQAGTILGKQCIVGSNAVVRGEFPDYSVIVGAPAKIVKRFDLLTQQWRKTKFNGEFIDENV